MDIMISKKRSLVEKLNKIYEPLFEEFSDLQELKSQVEETISEMEDQIINIGYDLGSLKELIDAEEEQLAKLILGISQGMSEEQVLKASIARIVR